MKSTVWFVLVSIFLGASSAVHAQQMPALPTGVRIVLATCNSIVLRKELLEQLRIELLSTGVVDIEVVDPDSPDASKEPKADRVATVQVYYPECDDSAGLVNLRITDRLTAKYVERTLVVSDVSSEARPRAVALAIVELLRASWLELVIAEDKAESSSSEAVRNRLVSRLKQATEDDDAEEELDPQHPHWRKHQERTVDPEIEADERWNKMRLEWLGGSRLYAQGAAADLSTLVKLSFALNRRLRLHTGITASGGGVRHRSDVTMFQGAGVLGIGISGGTSPELEVASVFEVGWSHIGGQDVRDVSRTTAVGTLQGTLRSQVTPGVDAMVGVQAGFVLAPLVLKDGTPGNRQTVGGYEGAVIGVLVGLAGIL